mmetsp:Transcript_11265/g.25259  ORF Transcript_11265/g.25259 Transcript_11265/m.25259 type:complete len:118 (-) Transcript_11265:128-481(-)
MPRMSGVAASMVILLAASSVQAVVWVKGSGGASCDTVCAARGGCAEGEFPKTAEEFDKITADTMTTCETIQEGGAKYDPSTDGHHCGWLGPDEGPRCDGAGDSGTYRFCPCNADKEL